ncbi:hypothetical protein GGD67_002902 [Bradyrhizobium sp. IAR9]|nr:hypothetical protein [Bradyrhizobium sp. IAR9]
MMKIGSICILLQIASYIGYRSSQQHGRYSKIQLCYLNLGIPKEVKDTEELLSSLRVLQCP